MRYSKCPPSSGQGTSLILQFFYLGERGNYHNLLQTRDFDGHPVIKIIWLSTLAALDTAQLLLAAEDQDVQLWVLLVLMAY